MVIPINGLPDGSKRRHWDLGKEFFATFGNSEILEASVRVDVKLEKSGDCIELDVNLDGTVTVPCDRCLAPLELEIGDTFRLSVKPGDLPEDAQGYDLSQDVYDYTCLSLPLKRVHDEGCCDPDVVCHLGRDEATVTGNKPFELLIKKIYNNGTS